LRASYRTAVASYKQNQLVLESLDQANLRHSRKPDLAIRARLESPPAKPTPAVVRPTRVLSVEEGVKLGERLMHHRGKTPEDGGMTSRPLKRIEGLLERGLTARTNGRRSVELERSHSPDERLKAKHNELLSVIKSASKYNHKRALSSLNSQTSSTTPADPTKCRTPVTTSELSVVVKSELDSAEAFPTVDTHFRTPRSSVDSLKLSGSSKISMSSLSYLGLKANIKNFEKLILHKA
jgi:hypothetical protein